MHSRPLFVLAFIVSIAIPTFAHAAIPFFGPIIPQTANQAVCAASWGMLIDVINNIISLLITLAIVFVAPLMIAYAGFLFVVNPVNASGKEQAKKILTNTIVGIVLALAGWMIVDALMAVLYNPDTLNGQTKLGVWSSLITSGGVPPCIPLAGSLNQVVPGVLPPDVVVVPGGGDEQAIRARLRAAGVTINNNPCPVGSNGSGCTNVAGMKPDTVQQIINIANACGGRVGFNTCGLVITGGTEPGHANGPYSHPNGYKVDIRPNNQLNAYIQRFTSVGSRVGDRAGPAWEDSCKNQYVLETAAPAHWDITVKAACGTTGGTGPDTGSVTCPTPPSDMITSTLAGPGNHLRAAQYSGQVRSIPLPALSGNSVQISLGETPSLNSPQPVTIEASISRCPGVIDSDGTNSDPRNFCNLRSTNGFYNSVVAFISPSSASNVDSVASAATWGYCWAPTSAGQWYFNVRWTYPQCPLGVATCGFVIQYNFGPS